MNGTRRLAAGLAIAIGLATLPATAHHSHGNYADTFIDLEGTVKEVHLVTPHSWVYIEVKNEKGEATLWALEAAGRQAILNNGVKMEDVRVGDRVKVRCHLLRDGSNGCLLGFVTPMHGDQARGHGVEKHWD